MRFGINSFLLTSGFTNDELSMIEQFGSWGADIIELAIHEPEKIDTVALRKSIEAAGMSNCPVCGMFPPERDLRGTEEQQATCLAYVGKLIDLASEIGSRVVAGPFYSSVGRCNLHSDAEKEQQADCVARNLATLCAKAERAGVTLAMEALNRFETDFINTADQAAAMIQKVGSPALKIHVDTFHMNIEEANPAEAIRRAGDLIGHVHASGSHRGTPGTGHVDWHGVFGALKEIGYGGDVVIETFSTDNDTIARAASIWIQRFDTPEQLAVDGLTFLRDAWAKA
jgi:D-psicose/D-tagatose/L-ribulose 3-epimerase